MNSYTRRLALITLTLVAACASNATSPSENLCDTPGVTPLQNGGCLYITEDIALSALRADLEAWILPVIDQVGAELNIANVEFRVRGPGSFIIPGGFGVGGRATTERVELEVDPAGATRPEGLRAWVEQITAHELHHVARLRTSAGKEKTVAALITLEGMADQYALGFGAGVIPDWSAALVGSELSDWTQRVINEHPQRNYSVNAWLFGTTPEIPNWTGYSVGFELVGRYIARTRRSAAESVGVSANEIIAAAR